MRRNDGREKVRDDGRAAAHGGDKREPLQRVEQRADAARLTARLPLGPPQVHAIHVRGCTRCACTCEDAHDARACNACVHAPARRRLGQVPVAERALHVRSHGLLRVPLPKLRAALDQVQG